MLQGHKTTYHKHKLPGYSSATCNIFIYFLNLWTYQPTTTQPTTTRPNDRRRRPPAHPSATSGALFNSWTLSAADFPTISIISMATDGPGWVPKVPIVTHDGSMGWTVYYPLHEWLIFTANVGKYTIVPWIRWVIKWGEITTIHGFKIENWGEISPYLQELFHPIYNW